MVYSNTFCIPMVYKTDEVHSFDSILIEQMKEKFHLTQKMAIDSLIKLSKYNDIFEEFTSYMKSGEELPGENCVNVEGYTAKRLHENYPLAILGAYNYLIYLRERPKEALEDLAKGLPRK